MIVDPKKTSTKDLHQFMLAAVSPRPIAFVSTVDEAGRPNLAPFSFFNAFSSNPPIVVFSANRRIKDNTTKHTLANIEATREAVINVVTYDIARQMTLTSIDYPAGISEFDKAGLTPVPSDLVRPPRVQESPVNMECRVSRILSLGDRGGAGNLIFCDVLRIHIDDEILDGMRINPHKLDIMGRLGRTNYVRVLGDAIMSIYQPIHVLGLGFDGLPKDVAQSPVLTGSEIAELAALPALPKAELVEAARQDPKVRACAAAANPEAALHRYAKQLIREKKADYALAVLINGIAV